MPATFYLPTPPQQRERTIMASQLMFLRVHDTVEDRSLFTGTGEVVYLRGNEAYVRYSDGSEEVVAAELFAHHSERHWTI